MTPDKYLEETVKFNLVWKKNATFRNLFYWLGSIGVLIFCAYYGRIYLNSGIRILYVFIPISLIAYLFIQRLYKSKVTELTQVEIETEKTKLKNKNEKKLSRLFFFIILGLIIISIMITSNKWFPL